MEKSVTNNFYFIFILPIILKNTMLLYYMLNENLLCLVILVLIIIVLFFYLFRIEKFTELTQLEYEQARDLVITEMEKKMEELMAQQSEQPSATSPALLLFYNDQIEKLKSKMNDSQLKNFIKMEQELLEYIELLAETKKQ